MSNTQKQSVGSIDRSNANVYSRQCTLPNPAPEGRTDTLQKNPPIVFFIGQLLAEYTQYPYINPTDIYFPIVGSIYPIQIYTLGNIHICKLNLYIGIGYILTTIGEYM